MTFLLPEGVHVYERGWLSSNNILFDDGHQSWLIDSGYCTHAAQTLGLIETKLGNRPLHHLINTHLHSDHAGGNAALQEKYADLVTTIPPGQSELVQNWDEVGLFYLPTGQQCPRFSFDQLLEIGSSLQLGLQSWEVHAAGGHDPHAVVLFEPVEKILISADALWENGFGVIFPELEGADAFDDVAQTFDLIERLSPKIVIPGHGSVFQFTPDILKTARLKLDGFVRDPVKLARHAAKVLLKFKLLQVQSLLFTELAQWALKTPCLKQYQQKFFADVAFLPWLKLLCTELEKAGVAKLEGDYIFNR